MTAKEYWEELNREYGADFEFPSEISFDNFGFQYDLAMGASVDAAIQDNLIKEISL